MKIFTLIILFAILLTSNALAQYTVFGKIMDSEGVTLPGASIVVKEIPTLGAVANSEGSYEIKLPNNKAYTLVASFIGYDDVAKSINADLRGALNFQLKENTQNLGEIVITGTRTPKLLKDAPIVTRVITEHDIQRTDATNIGDLLQTEMPGIEFSYSMNQQVSLNMSGFGGNSVLFLVDGERLAGETLDNIDYSRLNMDNVERIEIVKGAAS